MTTKAVEYTLESREKMSVIRKKTASRGENHYNYIKSGTNFWEGFLSGELVENQINNNSLFTN